MSITTVTSKGQITLPKRIRDRLALKVGDRLRVSTDRHGRVTLDREPAVTDLYGVLNRLASPRPAPLDDMRVAVEAPSRSDAGGNAPVTGLDFSDYLLGQLGRAGGARTTYTFDRALRNVEGFTVLT